MQEEIEPSVLGGGAKLAACMVIVAAAFAMGFSTGARHNVTQDGQVNERLEAYNQALFHRMMDHQPAPVDRPQAASTPSDEVASTPE